MYENVKKRLFRLKSNRIFETVVVTVIIISALEIGAKTYELPSFANTLTYGLDWFITLFFLFEIAIRFVAEEDKKAFFRSGWNVFDTVVVVMSLIPINDSELALLARLVRIFRVLRMISIIPELRTLINSLIKALPQMAYVVLLMFIIFYIYAAVGSYLFADINPFLWENIATSMLTLFRVMTFEDWTDIQYETMEVYGWSWIYYMSFIFLTAFAFLNMVIGIVVNVMNKEGQRIELAQQDADTEAADKEPSIRELQQEIRELKQLIVARKEANIE
ncbi:ion transporter [Idiomarina sp. HP20-50]|uniref:ion transporter n=1 Tax=Idiomarina sp. HP20-50 TaxID=3070813 RepID=UPI00294B3E38|nr:ion transporter [Idiomarina sp. HP20-50]MDV6314974.1 ion transporter [Idiomarina sp. HP20-50]